MSSPAVVLGTMFMGLCFVLDIIGIATDYWFVIGSDIFHAGLFRVCVLNICETYIAYKDTFLNVHYLGTAACSCLGCLLLFVATVIGFCGCSSHYAKPVVQNIGGVGLAGGFFGTLGFIWYYLYFFEDVFNTGSVLSTTLGNPGYSFYLSASASGAALVLAVIMVIAGCNMPVNGGVILPQQHQMVAVQSQQQQSYPAPSAPPNHQMYY